MSIFSTKPKPCIIFLFIFLLLFIETDGSHFNGGTIRWEPANPSVNSSSVAISIIQSYSWKYPTITCTTNVPISTSGRSSANANLTCIADCSTDGGYSKNPTNILTDCVSSSAALGMMTSEREVNRTLSADAHFYIAYQGSAWAPLGSPAKSGLYWSISCYIDLRMRPDGIINTPPEVNIVSPQYVIVNTPTQIQIPVSDANVGDDIRCRWSQYIPGYRRRREIYQSLAMHSESKTKIHQLMIEENNDVQVRNKRGPGCSWCNTNCNKGCCCKSTGCTGTSCSGGSCSVKPSCPIITTAGVTETPGTIPTTISYAHRQAIDECGSICYPNGLPNGTHLSSNCTLTFTGLIPNTWYAISVQVS
ncbi:unnamed protein product [Rotaria magnacalcarata]|uniref:Uncharacterized protein n=1 Tax=Rotaria magnacalcarata TaxID=392030 RepID=A0A816LYF7_9BILA|nr:unnamed protein product [Rotaria magnacalcarata]CAF2074363.1 unnamed protein product [Rotaria magnacalcarata]CAF4183234.1 unnamed protein product [Rotaria magnacalcarata]CAF4199880.1 unnamed protein product [Rotaria magnacalcarata]